MADRDKIYFAGLDRDTEDRMLPAGSYRYALNCNIAASEESNVGGVENVSGNKLIVFDLPPGENQCISTYEDIVNDTIIYFVHNSMGEHQILRFYPHTSSIVKIVKSSVLNFQADQLISGVALEDDLLYWTDGIILQRKINIEKAREDKNLIVNLYFEFSPPVNTNYTLIIKDSDGFTLENSLIYTVPGPNIPSIEEITSGITQGINALDQSPNLFTAKDAGTFVRLKINTQGYYTVIINGNPKKAIAVYENMYPRPFKESYITLIKPPPLFPPIQTLVNTGPNTSFNDTFNKMFEFRTRYIYDDHEKSVLSPISKQLPESPHFNQNSFLLIDYSTERLIDPAELCILQKLELFVRESNTGTWKKIRTFSQADMVGNNNTFYFFNNEAYSAISEDESDKSFDMIPLLSNTLEIMNNRLFLDAKLEGYDPVVPDVRVSLKVNEEIPFLGLTDRGLFLKRPGFYKWALAYFDFANRSSTVSTLPSMELGIPGYSDDLTQFSYVLPGTGTKRRGTVEFNWSIRHRPPVWATHYCWLRTKDSIHNHYQVSRVGTVTYLKADKQTASTYGSSDAAYIHLDFTHWNSFNDNYPDADYGWTLKEGDKIRFLKSAGNTWNATIVEQKIDSQEGATSFIIPNQGGIPQQQAGSLVEFFTPGKDTENTFYFETGEFFPIINPGQENRFHKGQFSDQDPNNPISTPASGTFIRGDNHRTPLYEDSGTPVIVDSPVADMRYGLNLNNFDWGRANVFSDDVGAAKRGNTVRISNKRFSDTNINGYSSFDSLNAKDLLKSYGHIVKLARVDNILLSLHTREAVSLYIEENIYTDVTGQSTITISDKIIGKDRVLRGGFGTENPESVVLQDSKFYWFCSSKGQYIRYSGDGLTPISDSFMQRYFHTKGRLIKKYGGKVWSTYDVNYGKVIVAFSKISHTEGTNEIIDSDPETLAYDERTNRWTSFFSFHPEFMVKSNTHIISFKQGKLYLHDENVLHNNFYGVQYSSQVKAVFNRNPSQVKVFSGISIEATDLWLPKELTTPEGQKSSLQVQDFEQMENIFYAAILRDEQTPNVENPITQGDALRSTILRMLVENSNTNKSVLYFATVDAIPSFLSNT